MAAAATAAAAAVAGASGSKPAATSSSSGSSLRRAAGWVAAVLAPDAGGCVSDLLDALQHVPAARPAALSQLQAVVRRTFPTTAPPAAASSAASTQLTEPSPPADAPAKRARLDPAALSSPPAGAAVSTAASAPAPAAAADLLAVLEPQLLQLLASQPALFAQPLAEWAATLLCEVSDAPGADLDLDIRRMQQQQPARFLLTILLQALPAAASSSAILHAIDLVVRRVAETAHEPERPSLLWLLVLLGTRFPAETIRVCLHTAVARCVADGAQADLAWCARCLSHLGTTHETTLVQAALDLLHTYLQRLGLEPSSAATPAAAPSGAPPSAAAPSAAVPAALASASASAPPASSTAVSTPNFPLSDTETRHVLAALLTLTSHWPTLAQLAMPRLLLLCRPPLLRAAHKAELRLELSLGADGRPLTTAALLDGVSRVLLELPAPADIVLLVLSLLSPPQADAAEQQLTAALCSWIEALVLRLHTLAHTEALAAASTSNPNTISGDPMHDATHDATQDHLHALGLLAALQRHASDLAGHLLRLLASPATGDQHGDALERAAPVFHLLLLVGSHAGPEGASQLLSELLLGTASTLAAERRWPVIVTLLKAFAAAEVDCLAAWMQRLVVSLPALSDDELDALLRFFTALIDPKSSNHVTGARAMICRHWGMLFRQCIQRGLSVAATGLRLLINLSAEPMQAWPRLLRSACQGVVDQLFCFLEARQDSLDPKYGQVVVMLEQLLVQLVHQRNGGALVMGHLLQNVLTPHYNKLFQAYKLLLPARPVAPILPPAERPRAMRIDTPAVSLLQANAERHGSRVGYFHTGVIGSGKFKRRPHDDPDTAQRKQDFCVENTHVVVRLVMEAMRADDGAETLVWQLSSRIVTALSTTTPQQYQLNLPKRPTFPRDVALAKAFDSNPLLWELMLVAAERPELFCRCADIVNSLMAWAVGTWNSIVSQQSVTASFIAVPKDDLEPTGPGGVTQDAGADDVGVSACLKPYMHELTIACLLFELVRKAQLVPLPLAAAGEILPFLNPSEIFELLLACLGTMLGHPPQPSHYEEAEAAGAGAALQLGPAVRRTFTPEVHDLCTKPLRLAMAANIARVGPMYARIMRLGTRDLERARERAKESLSSSRSKRASKK